MRLIDADALKEKKVYSHERHEKVVPVAEIDWMPTIDAIPVEWLKKKAREMLMINERNRIPETIEFLLSEWRHESEEDNA